MKVSSPGPFLRWAGSKRKLFPKLVPYWDAGYTRYVEPFMGSASLFFSLRPENALLSDINPDLVSTFTTVKNCPAALSAAVNALRKGSASYYRIRKAETKGMDEIQKAARFIFLNRFCFNGLYRTNAMGRFNVPFSSAGTGNLPTLEELLLASDLLKRATILCDDFAVAINQVRRGDFVYLDPPYAVTNRRVFRQYGPSSFGISDLIRLSQGLNAIDACGAAFVLSYAHCSEALQYLKGWNVRKVMTQRNISGFAKHRRKAAELIVTNINTAE
ncbi:MAG: Dam family site-specific DNA-(adenine-N6)-methyltransferase [Acidobacteriia bacterium]|nr:Dam family site-specific DNA-(adenine-N6)-methyltransferase [Terriglobia bacterium]